MALVFPTYKFYITINHTEITAPFVTWISTYQDENLCTRVIAFGTSSRITASSTCNNYCSPVEFPHSLLH